MVRTDEGTLIQIYPSVPSGVTRESSEWRGEGSDGGESRGLGLNFISEQKSESHRVENINLVITG